MSPQPTTQSQTVERCVCCIVKPYELKFECQPDVQMWALPLEAQGCLVCGVAQRLAASLSTAPEIVAEARALEAPRSW